MRKKVIIATVLAATFFCSSCSKKEGSVGTESAPVKDVKTFVDHTGSSVTISAAPQRVVISSLLPLPSVYCLYLGGPYKLVGMHLSSKAAGKNSYLAKFYPEINDIDSSFVKNNVVNIEQLLELKPDLILYNASNAAEKEMFDTAGIPCVGFSTTIAGYNTIETYASWITQLGEIFGDTGRSKEIIEYGRNVEKMVKERTSKLTDEQRPICLYLYACEENSITTYGGNMFNQYWCETCGGRNASYELKGSNSLNMEQIYN